MCGPKGLEQRVGRPRGLCVKEKHNHPGAQGIRALRRHPASPRMANVVIDAQARMLGTAACNLSLARRALERLQAIREPYAEEFVAVEAHRDARR